MDRNKTISESYNYESMLQIILNVDFFFFLLILFPLTFPFKLDWQCQ